MFRSFIAVLGAALVAGAGAVAPAAAADDGWHPVDEKWQPYVYEHGLTLPAERYCGDFDMTTDAVFQDVRYRVLSRWDSGGPRVTEYTGPLLNEVTNVETGSSVQLSMSGRAVTLQREDGSLARYESKGPIGMGFPVGSIGLDPGFYLFEGYHVVEFPESGPRRLVVDQGTESNICDMVD